MQPSIRSALRLVPGALVTALVAATFMAVPLAAQQPAGTTAARADSAPHRINLNWLSDRRSFAVGDIIKVSVEEFAQATANKGTVSQASRSRKMDLGASPPDMGSTSSSPIGDIKGSIQSSDGGESRQSGQATRGTSYQGEIPVRVVEVTPEGMLKVKGAKVIDVDKNKQELTITGLVRPQDINSRDVVLSSSIADAQIIYKSKGLDKPKSGILGRIIGIIWP